jgi:chromosome segregation ATPase
MGQYLSTPQGNRQALGEAFFQKYKYNFSPDSEITTSDVLDTMHDALQYQQLRKRLEKIYKNKSPHEWGENLDEIGNLLQETKPSEIIYSSNPKLADLQTTIAHLRDQLKEHEKCSPEYKRLSASFDSAEHSIEILQKENTSLEKERSKFIKLIKRFTKETNQSEKSFNELQMTSLSLQRELRILKRQEEVPQLLLNQMEKELERIDQQMERWQKDFLLVGEELIDTIQQIEQLEEQLELFAAEFKNSKSLDLVTNEFLEKGGVS